MKVHLVAYILPLSIMALVIPMALQWVPPNGVYGFRTTKTLSSPEVWFKANRVSAFYMIAALALSTIFNLILWWTQSDWPESRLVFWMGNSIGVSVFLSLIPSFLYLRKL